MTPTLTVEESVLATLAYFSVFSYPLTVAELQRFLWGQSDSVPRGVVEKTLEVLRVQKKIAEQNGQWFLSGEETVIAFRATAEKIVDTKIVRAKRAMQCISWIPFLRAMFVCNTAGMGTAKQESDIDVYIVVAAGRLWLTRLLTTLTLTFTRMRRTKRRVADRICLSFFVTDDALDLTCVALEGVDVYLMYWLRTLVPVYDPTNVYRKSAEANTFVRPFLPFVSEPFSRADIQPSLTVARIKKVLEKMWGGVYGDLVEAQAKGVQEMKMKRNKASIQHVPDTRVVVNDHMLKFHENDRRDIYRQAWLHKCQSLGILPYEHS